LFTPSTGTDLPTIENTMFNVVNGLEALSQEISIKASKMLIETI